MVLVLSFQNHSSYLYSGVINRSWAEVSTETDWTKKERIPNSTNSSISESDHRDQDQGYKSHYDSKRAGWYCWRKEMWWFPYLNNSRVEVTHWSPILVESRVWFVVGVEQRNTHWKFMILEIKFRPQNSCGPPWPFDTINQDGSPAWKVF